MLLNNVSAAIKKNANEALGNNFVHDRSCRPIALEGSAARECRSTKLNGGTIRRVMVKEIVESKVSVDAGSQGSGGDLVLHGLPVAPPLDVPTEWPEARRVVVPANSHRQRTYFLNKGARLQAAYSVKSEDGVPHPLCIIIAQAESFMRWAEMPSLQSSTLFWRLVQGNGTIEQTVNLS
ncbi:unnamed protein product [Miscanthus lutarioriparius]|uniref:E3 ubiquitin-protein ligase APD1-4 N-terminal domain-containing protein n=1 Tax=Miscanthus lutarioriparius TaxID=422564 RepID=A0A811QIR3_9POAL|nr:unnamed protein product [Miscanthus lutarioriparius]